MSKTIWLSKEVDPALQIENQDDRQGRHKKKTVLHLERPPNKCLCTLPTVVYIEEREREKDHQSWPLLIEGHELASSSLERAASFFVLKTVEVSSVCLFAPEGL